MLGFLRPPRNPSHRHTDKQSDYRMPLGHSHISTMLCWKSWLLSACHIVIVLIQLLIKEAGLCIVWYKCTYAHELVICACSVHSLAWLWLHRSFTLPMKWWCVTLVVCHVGGVSRWWCVTLVVCHFGAVPASFWEVSKPAWHLLVHVYTYKPRGVPCWCSRFQVSVWAVFVVCTNKVAVNTLRHMHSKRLVV